ncbi:MAG: winged helix-turn-helix transcriptional regulator, partial [Candidatus Freyarchaeota archaeon]
MTDVTISLKVPREILHFLDEKVGQGRRSEFIRQAIIEKLKMSNGDARDPIIKEIDSLKRKVEELERILRVHKLGGGGRKQHPLYRICRDENDRKIVEYLLREGGATTKELEKVVGLKRRQILNRMKYLSEKAEKELGRGTLRY